MSTCHRCDETPDDDAILDHLRLLHPDAYGDGPEKWPDGSIVIEDDTVNTPEDM